tara:strand:+ start:875 stop:1114 length:240 start_codon:yes stop_codon:yes gene_type:complete
MEKEKYERIYDVLLNETELLSKEGVTTFEMSNVMSDFLIQLVFDTAPTPMHSAHMLLNKITQRLETEVEKWHDDLEGDS